MKQKRNLGPIKKLLQMQLVITLIAVAFSLWWGKKEGLSAFLGGVAVIIPTMIFARKLFKYQGARAARQIVKSFYVGEALKIVTSFILFGAIFMTITINPLVFFLTYIVVVMVHWFAPLLIDNQQNRPESD